MFGMLKKFSGRGETGGDSKRDDKWRQQNARQYNHFTYT